MSYACKCRGEHEPGCVIGAFASQSFPEINEKPAPKPPMSADDKAAFERQLNNLIQAYQKASAAAERTKADSQARDSTEQPHQTKIPTQPQGEGEQSP